MRKLIEWMDRTVPGSPPFLWVLALVTGVVVCLGGNPLIGLGLMAVCIWFSFL